MHARIVQLVGIRVDVHFGTAEILYLVSHGPGFTQVRALLPDEATLKTLQAGWKHIAISDFGIAPHKRGRGLWLSFGIASQASLSVEPLYKDARDPLYPEVITYTYSSDYGQPAVQLKIRTRIMAPELVEITIEPTTRENIRTQARRARARGDFHRALVERFGITPYGELDQFNLRFTDLNRPNDQELLRLIVEAFSPIDRFYPRS